MDDPIVPPTKPINGNGNGNGNARLAPSNSTVGSGIGGALAVLIVMICHERGLDFPAGAEAAISVLITAIAGYIPTAGRK
jgi:hypothetical protein